VESFCSEWEGERLRLYGRQAPKRHHHFHSTELISSYLVSDTILSAFIARPGSGHLVIGLALGRSLGWSRGQIATECCCGVCKGYIAVCKKHKRKERGSKGKKGRGQCMDGDEACEEQHDEQPSEKEQPIGEVERMVKGK
jgi:hypothetical protein